jgi:pyruvate/2-oxoglutarate dehydrogenase complex dihydrolipoamide dehydrogenase (E3) component
MTRVLTPDICVIGAGSGGLSVAAAAAAFGVEVVLIEKGKMGGDCLNYGCVPSKALIASAKAAHHAAHSTALGVSVPSVDVDFQAVHDHVHGVIGAIAPHDSVERFEGLGVEVVQETARFVDHRTVRAGDTDVRARRFVVATGSSPAVPPIPGLDTVPYLTNEPCSASPSARSI